MENYYPCVVGFENKASLYNNVNTAQVNQPAELHIFPWSPYRDRIEIKCFVAVVIFKKCLALYD